MKWLWMIAIGCSAPAPAHVAQPVHEHKCVQLDPPSARELYGRVTDPAGQPLGGVAVEELDWSPGRGDWTRLTLNKTATRADGTYVLPIVHGPDAVITFELDRRQVVWARVDGSRRIDVELDRAMPAGVIAVRDGRVESSDPCGAWTCPIDRAPEEAWWTHARPCPDGAHVRYALGSDVAGVSVLCEFDGQPHGASTTWAMTPEHQWTEHVGWYEHGRRCGQWRDTPELPPVDHPGDQPLDHPGSPSTRSNSSAKPGAGAAATSARRSTR